MTPLSTKLKTKEEKLEYLSLIEERERRARERGTTYFPNEGQEQVHLCNKSLRCVFSGNGAGKTALGVNEAIWWAQGYNPILKQFTKVPSRVIVLLDDPSKVNDVWMPEILKWTHLKEEQLHKRGKPYYTRISFPNGSEILFFFHEQSPLVFESIELDYLIADEPPPRNVYIALRRGARKRGRQPKFLMIGTPITAAWMRTEILEPWSKGELPDTECFRFGTSVNEANLAEGYIESFSRILSEKEKRIRLHGEFFDLEGLALAHLFDRNVHIVEPFEWSRENPVVIAIDPHPKKAHFACMVGVDKEGYLYYLKELKVKCTARPFAEQLKEWMAGYTVVDIVSDSLGSSEYTSGEGFTSFIQMLNNCGIRCRATTWDEKQDEDFIERIRGALEVPIHVDNFGNRTPKLRIFKGNHGIIGDVENVQWVKMRNLDEYKPKLDISNKDFLSTLKYALATNISFMKAKAKVYTHTRGAETYGIDKTVSRRPRILRRLQLNKKRRAKRDENFGEF